MLNELPKPRSGRPAPLEVPILEPAPRVTVRAAGREPSVELTPDATESLEVWRARFLRALGTTESNIAEALFQHVIDVLHTDPKKPFESATANLVLALLHRVAPKDELEAMLACQMIVTHIAAMDASRRALHVKQTS